MNFTAPHIDYAGLSPVIALTAGLVIVLMVGLIPRLGRFSIAYLTVGVLAAPPASRSGSGARTRTWWPALCGSMPSAWRRR
jgi:hypothetical protein